MSYWCPKSEGATSDINSTRSILTQIMASNNEVNWDNIQKRLEMYPHEAAEVDRFGVTVLHHIIRKYIHIPIDVLRLLIDEYPLSLSLCDKMTGCNALHIACGSKESDKMKDIIQLIIERRMDACKQSCFDGRLPLHKCKDENIAKQLIDIYPEGIGAVTKVHGYLPLHDACSDNMVSTDVVKLFIRCGMKNRVGNNIGDGLYCGGLLLKDLHGDIPIKIIFRRVLFMKSSFAKAPKKDTKHILHLDPKRILWQKLCLVAKVTYLAIHGIPYNDETISEIPLIHAIIECGAQSSIVKYALQLHPDQIFLRDKDGRVPLSIASAKVDTNPDIFPILLDRSEDADYENLHSRSCDSSSIVQRVRTSTASMADMHGRLPLHLAVSSGRTWNNGVHLIASAAPLALQTRDAKSGMYPFMLASIPNYRWDNSCIDTIYSLIREAPHVLKRYCDHDEKK